MTAANSAEGQIIARLGPEHDSDSDRSEAATGSSKAERRLAALNQRIFHLEAESLALRAELSCQARQATEKDGQLMLLRDKLQLSERVVRSAQADAAAKAAQVVALEAMVAQAATAESWLPASVPLTVTEMARGDAARVEVAPSNVPAEQIKLLCSQLEYFVAETARLSAKLREPQAAGARLRPVSERGPASHEDKRRSPRNGNGAKATPPGRAESDLRQRWPQASFVQQVFGVQVWHGDPPDEELVTVKGGTSTARQKWPEVPPAEAALHGEHVHYDAEEDVTCHRTAEVRIQPVCIY